ncbi:hypothetical protein F8388_019585 [Cannabis sativa]|uniref:Uncharacterized protein n=1 Tax=Cannabis sativa TaxID=3483 RepID=A0A7J6FHY2_CANSA|nr:hypothetical protein F8388_019585 [Cannabis sativa]
MVSVFLRNEIHVALFYFLFTALNEKLREEVQRLKIATTALAETSPLVEYERRIASSELVDGDLCQLPLRFSLNCHEILSNLLPLIGNLRFTDAIFVVQSKPHLGTLRELQRLYDELVDSANICRLDRYTASEKVGRSRWLWSRFMPQSSYSPVKGLYLYGGVGTGKTMLMDLFYDQLPCNWRKKQIHFHDFMLNVHSRLQVRKHF